MIAKLTAVVLVALVSCKPASEAESPPDEGELQAGIAGAHRLGMRGPAMILKTLDGESIDLAKLYGTKPIYLKFWATWCTPCREQMPGFEHIFETLGDRIQVIAVDAGLNDDVSAVRAFREKYGLHMPIVVDDGSLAAAFDLQVTPQHVLVGRDARIAYIGHHDGAKLDEAIRKVLSQPSTGDVAGGQAVVLPPAFRPGDRVRGLHATLSDGTTVELGAGRPRALVFFADWCESYLEHTQPQTSQACRRVREDVDRLMTRGDVDWLGVATGVWSSAQSIDDYKSQTKTQLPVARDADGALFRAFGVRDMPTVVLLDRPGRLVRVLGPDDRDLEGALRALR
jgi:peroxiredoxin